MSLIPKTTKTNERLFWNNLCTSTILWVWINKQIFKFHKEIICDTQINDNIKDIILFSQIVFTIP